MVLNSEQVQKMTRNNFKGVTNFLQDPDKNTPRKIYKVFTQGPVPSKIDKLGRLHHSSSNFDLTMADPGANLSSTSRMRGKVPPVNPFEFQDKPRVDNVAPQKPRVKKMGDFWTHLKRNSTQPRDQMINICSTTRADSDKMYFTNIGGKFDTNPDSLMEVKWEKPQDKASDRILPVVNNKLGGTMRVGSNSKRGLLSKQSKTRHGLNSNSVDATDYMTAVRKKGMNQSRAKPMI